MLAWLDWLLVVGTVGITGWLLVYARSRRQATVLARDLMGVVGCQFLLALSELLLRFSPTATVAQFWFNLRFIFLEGTAVYWLLLTVAMSGQLAARPRWMARVLWGLPLVLQALLWTNPWHHLWVAVDAQIVAEAGYWRVDYLARVPAIGFWLHAFYCIGLMIVGALFLVDHTWRSRGWPRRVALWLLASTLVGVFLPMMPTAGQTLFGELNPLWLGTLLSMLVLAGVVRQYPVFSLPLAQGNPGTSTPGWLLVAFPLLIGLIGALGAYSLQSFVVGFRSEVETQLASVASLKTDELVNWRQERLRDGATLYRNPAFTRLVVAAFGPAPDPVARADLVAWLERLQTPEEYANLLLLDMQGQRLLELPPRDTPVGADYLALVNALTPDSPVSLLDFHRHDGDESVYLSLLVPILGEDDAGQPLALLILHIDPRVYLYPYIQEWPTATASAETLLVRREGDEVVFLNELRFREDAPLALRRPLAETSLPAAQAVLGRTGVIEGRDYRGEEVVAAALPVEDSPWYLVARMDRTEVYAPLVGREVELLVLVAALLAASWAAFEAMRRQYRWRAVKQALAAAADLHESEVRFRILVEESPVPIFIQTDTRFAYLNRAAQELFGVGAGQTLVGKPVIEHFHPEDREAITARIHRLNELKQAAPAREERIVRGDGSAVAVEVSAVPFEWERRSGALVFAYDLTARKAAEAALRASEDRFRLLFESSMDALLISDGHGHVLTANAALCAMIGRDEVEVLSLTREDIFDERDPRLSAALAQRRQTGYFRGELTMLHKDGHTIPVEFSSSLYSERGMSRASVVVHDITARKAAEDALRASEERYRLLFETSLDGILLATEDGLITAANPTACALLGYTEAEICALARGALVDMRDPRVAAGLAERARTGSFQGEITMLHKDGSKIPVEISSALYTDPRVGRRASIVLRDVRERRAAEDALRASEEQYRALFDVSMDAVLVSTADGPILRANPAACALFGWTEAEFQSLDPAVPNQLADQSDPRLHEVREVRRRTGQYRGELTLLRRDGSKFLAELTTTLFTDANGTLLSSMLVRDITARKAAEDALRASEERFRTLVEQAPMPIYIQTGGLLRYVNGAALQLFGAVQADAVVGTAILDRFAPEFRERVRARLHRVNELREAVPPAEMVIVKLDGSTVPIEVSAVPFMWEGQPGALAYAHDLTTRKAAEAALRRSEAALRQAQAVAHVGHWVWHIDSNQLEWSDEMYHIFGIDKASFTGDLRDVIDQAIHPDDRARVEAVNRSVSEDGRPHPLDYRVVGPDGTVRWVYAEAGELLYDEAGQPMTLTGIVQDITERKRAEDALRESEVRYRNLVDMAPVAITVGVEDRFVFVNAAGLRMLRLASVQEATEIAVSSLFLPERLAAARARQERVLRGEQGFYSVEEVLRRPDGTLVDVELVSTQILYEGQTAIQSIVTDISLRKAAEAQLRLQAVALESAANAIVIADANGEIRWANPAYTALTGYTAEESALQNQRALVQSDVQDEAFYARMWATIQGGQVWQGQLVNRRKDGSLYDEEVTITPVRDAVGTIQNFIAVKQDVSERIQRERELTIIAQVNTALRSVITRQATIVTVLQEVCSLLRVEGALIGAVDEMHGNFVVEQGYGLWADLGELMIIRGIGPITQIRERRHEYLNNHIAGDPQFAPFDFLRSCTALAGVPLLVQQHMMGILWVGSSRTLSPHDMRLLGAIGDITANALYREALHADLEAYAQRLAQVMETVPQGILLFDTNGEILVTNPVAKRILPLLTDELAVTTLTRLGDRALAELLTSPPQGMRHEVRAAGRIVEVVTRPIPNGPSPEQWVMLLDDVTQARQVQTQFQQQERLATVGQLAAGIAHDFNNIMAVIVLYADMAARTPTLPERDRERLLMINAQAQRASALIRQILDFSRQSVLERQNIDLQPLVKEQVKLLERTLPESIELHYTPSAEPCVVSADATRMQQLVMNLAINARDAMPEGGELLIDLQLIDVEPGKSPLLPEMAPGKWVRLTIADTGTGIPSEVLPHIFDPFFTTKAPGKGTGLGLAQVHGIVAQHAGRLDVKTKEGEGTTFTVYLPALIIVPAEVVPLWEQSVPVGHGEQILIVEDNLALRGALTEMVRGMNYRVLEAANGQEALALLTAQQGEVALILSDVVMPGMGGIPFVHTLRQRGMQVPVVFITGHPMEREQGMMQEVGVEAWMMKPIHPHQLAHTLAEVLQRQRER